MPVKKENTLNKCFINTRPLKTGPREGKPKPSCLHWIKKRRSVFVDLDKRGVCGPAYILPPHTNAEPTKTNKKYSDKISNKKITPNLFMIAKHSTLVPLESMNGPPKFKINERLLSNETVHTKLAYKKSGREREKEKAT